MKEEWKQIDWHDDFYEVSNKGRIRSWKNRKRTKLEEPRILKQWLSVDGYPKIQLSHFDKNKSLSVHKLVALNFVPNPCNYKIVNHKDSNKENNVYTNLQWCTNRQNQIHAIQNGQSANVKLTPKDIKIIRFLLKNYDNTSHNYVSDLFNVSRKTISDINARKTWNHVHGIATIDEVEKWVKQQNQ